MTTYKYRGNGHPFHITQEENQELRQKAASAIPSPVISHQSSVISQASSFDEYVQQLMIPPVVMDMARKAENMRLSPWEIAAMRKHLAPAKHHDKILAYYVRFYTRKPRLTRATRPISVLPAPGKVITTISPRLMAI